MPATSPSNDGLAGRARSLDGLRGLAAVVVLVHHVLLIYPPLSSAYGLGDTSTSGWGWLIRSPLHLLWAGGEAVIIFFIISGIVLVLPVLRSSKFNWRSYYPSRLVRLYLPVMASVVLALALAMSVPRADLTKQSGWLAFHSAPPTAVGFLRDLILLTGIDNLSSPLWSLRWEVVFSLLLPLYVLVARKAERLWWALALLAIAVSTLGSRNSAYEGFQYLPVFFLGAIVAVHHGRLAKTAKRIRDEAPAATWPVIVVTAAVGLVIPWLLPVVTLQAPDFPEIALRDAVLPIVEISAVVIVLAAIYWQPFVRFLESRLVQWFGLISFSLYLVHEPVIVTTAALFPETSWWVTPLLGVPVAFLIAWLFSRFVEQPVHQLSRRIRARLATDRPVSAQR